MDKNGGLGIGKKQRAEQITCLSDSVFTTSSTSTALEAMHTEIESLKLRFAFLLILFRKRTLRRTEWSLYMQ